MNNTLPMNRFHGDKWTIAFSNMPSVDQQKIDMRLFDLYVKNIVLPDFFVETANSEFMSESSRHSMSRTNDNLTQLTIEFKVDESMENYYDIYEWIQALRYHKDGINISKFKDNTIKSIDVFMLDNQKRTRGKLRFTNSIITNLGALTLNYGDSSEVTFACSFMYEEAKLIRQDG